ncbi:MAG: LamG domain-containing protein [Candidatus Poribacteria bacterium]|nr:LamG domain-containing protein [Candidatus Poribacteria bacterium]
MKSVTGLLTFMIVSITLSSHVYGLPCVTDGLVSYWTFDKSNISGRKVEDVWGDNNAIIKGNPKVVTGQIGEALEFDGSEDYVNLTNLGDFGSQMGSSTFEAWIKVGHKNDWMVLFKVRDKDCMQWEFNIHSGRRRAKDEASINHRIAFKAPGENACQGFGVRDRPIKILDGKWHHIVYTNEIVKKDIAAIGKTFRQHNIYVDGKPISSLESPLMFTGTFIPFVKPVHLGAGDNQNFFKGSIDEVRIYNRPLTETEVIQNFESRTGLSVEPNSPLPIAWGTIKTAF